MVLHSADRFRAAAAPHVVVYVFVSNYEWRESETLSFNVCLRVHQTTLNYPLLGGISSCPQWCCTRRIVFERLLHHTLWSMFLFRIMNGGSQHSLSMYVCVFTHWTPNNPELSAAWRNFASSCPQCSCEPPHVVVYVSNYEWRESRIVLLGGISSGSQHVVVYVFVSNYEWRESETRVLAAWRNFASSCPQWCCTRRIVFERLLHHTLWSMFLFRIMNGAAPHLAAWRNFASSCPQWCCTRRIVFERLLHHTLLMNGSLSMYVCVFTHWTPNNPELSAAWRNFELLPTMVLLGGRFRAAAAPHVVVYVFVSNYEWRESETLASYNGAALGGSFSSGCCTTRRIMNGGSQNNHTLDTKQP
ncbi:hypothetical protein TcBrA4_0018240 [Trypanosoma cruzi]|nr:hypothetical protein TcBrA4_0018240 [Trypanosoma cruzi]